MDDDINRLYNLKDIRIEVETVKRSSLGIKLKFGPTCAIRSHPRRYHWFLRRIAPLDSLLLESVI